MSSEFRLRTDIVIDRRFNGPPASANGGFTCGLMARLVSGTAEVSLKSPPPLSRPLQLTEDDGTVRLLDADATLAQATTSTLDVGAGEPIGYDEAFQAAQAFDMDAFRSVHYFPTCFTCGPDRAPGDGLRLFPGHIEREQPITAWPWTPDASLPSIGGSVAAEIMWAALDCPSGWASYHVAEPDPHVLGRLTAQINRPARLGERTVVGGWPIERSGRAEQAGSAIWSADGELLASARATWISLTEEQFERFRVAVS